MVYEPPDLPDSPPDEPEIPDDILRQAEKDFIKEKIGDLTSAVAEGYYNDEINRRAEEIMAENRRDAGEAAGEDRAAAIRSLDGTGGP